MVVDGLTGIRPVVASNEENYGQDRNLRLRIDTIWDKSKGLAKVYEKEFAARQAKADRTGKDYLTEPQHLHANEPYVFPTAKSKKASYDMWVTPASKDPGQAKQTGGVAEPDVFLSSRKGTKGADVNTPSLRNGLGTVK